MSYYVHNVPGRMRLKSPLLKKNPHVSRQAEDLVRQLHGIRLAVANPTTGSLTVHYDPKEVGTDAIVELLEREELFDKSQAVSKDRYIAKSMGQAGETLGKVLMTAAMEKALESAGLSFLAVLI